MLQGIKLSESLTNQFTGTNFFGTLNNTSQLNTFVGANNSGKSRFLRTIFSDPENVKYIFEIDETQIKNILKIGIDFLNSLNSLRQYNFKYEHQKAVNEIVNNIKHNNNNALGDILSLYEYYKTLSKSDFEIDNQREYQLTNFLSNSRSQAQSLGSLINRLGTESSKVYKIYIPVLRGLRPISKKESGFTNEDLYLQRTNHDYFKVKIPLGETFTGLSIYEKVKRLLLGDESERNEIKNFENFLGENVFKKKVNLIPKYDDDVLHIKIENEPQHPIYRLGDGLQTLIIILFPIFINRNKRSVIFIEEPETHLHPKWQRLLYRAMTMPIFNNHTYFITTHSSVFINSKQNSIFIVSKLKSKTNLHYSDIKTEKIAILKDLGYKPNDLYQTNYLLWVEGQSDKIYINHFIKSIDETLIEGEDYSIMFYGGSSYKHFLENKGDLSLEFIESLNQNYGIIMDSDRTKQVERYSLKKKKIVELFNDNKAFCWLTRFREFENYLPYDEFINSVKSVHKVKNIKIDKSPFADRCIFENLDAKPTFKPRIKLSNDLFSKIQKNNGSLKGIPVKNIRNEIEKSILSTQKSINNIDKIKVAENLVANKIEMKNDELIKKMEQLVKEIKNANT